MKHTTRHEKASTFSTLIFFTRYEALGLLLLYLGYIVLMYFNSNLEQWIVPKFKHCCKPHHRPNKRDPETVVLYEKLRTSGDLNGKVSKMENGGGQYRRSHT